MPKLPEFSRHLEKMEDIHKRKNEDYAEGDPLENFNRAADLISWFDNPSDATYVNHIATKLARLATLLNKKYINPDLEPNNESIDDSFLDLNTYANLWWCDYERRGQATTEREIGDKEISSGVLPTSACEPGSPNQQQASRDSPVGRVIHYRCSDCAYTGSFAREIEVQKILCNHCGSSKIVFKP